MPTQKTRSSAEPTNQVGTDAQVLTMVNIVKQGIPITMLNYGKH